MKRNGFLFTLLLLALPAQAATNMYFIHNDHLGSPNVVTDGNQEVVWKGHMQPFGEMEVEVEALTNHRRFPGQRYDIESRLHYNYFRDYDPSLGRYVQSDPIGLDGGLNTFGYALQNPVLYTDPRGLQVSVLGALFRFGPVCGSAGNEHFVPDWRWREACRKHDECYSTCGKSKEHCDLEFCHYDGACLYGFLVDGMLAGPAQQAYHDAQEESGCDDCQ